MLENRKVGCGPVLRGVGLIERGEVEKMIFLKGWFYILLKVLEFEINMKYVRNAWMLE